jgi:cytochrome d ubiquinol oxidase subunit I
VAVRADLDQPFLLRAGDHWAGLLAALLQTTWHRNKNAEYLRLPRFFGTLLVINVTVGVVTGLVQEFESGMNWSAYSRLIGDIFGAPLAMEGLAAFFLESTFLGLWLSGWDKLSRRVHLLCIWLVMIFLPLVLLYQAWTYYVVRQRLSPGDFRPPALVTGQGNGQAGASREGGTQAG